MLSYITDVSGGVISFDARKFNYEWDPYNDLPHTCFGASTKKDLLYKALHVDNSYKTPIYIPVSS